MSAQGQNRASCEGCFYHRLLSQADKGFKCCHYCLIEGKPRGCPADRCDKKLVVDKETERKMIERYHYQIIGGIAKGGADNA